MVIEVEYKSTPVPTRAPTLSMHPSVQLGLTAPPTFGPSAKPSSAPSIQPTNNVVPSLNDESGFISYDILAMIVLVFAGLVLLLIIGLLCVYIKLHTTTSIASIPPVVTYGHPSPAPPSTSLSPHSVRKEVQMPSQGHNAKDIGCLEIEPVDIEGNGARHLATL
jgi:hypothetical protein